MQNETTTKTQTQEVDWECAVRDMGTDRGENR